MLTRPSSAYIRSYVLCVHKCIFINFQIIIWEFIYICPKTYHKFFTFVGIALCILFWSEEMLVERIYADQFANEYAA